ncbi:MAG: hypothetical protein KGJ60_14360 [Verrucomicrobiota bacterium]|nr:hypothetical protein [Verrucomicrobiota bacterium]
MLAAFGQPAEGDGYKTQVEWIISTPDGIATLYDWKRGDCYHGKGNGTPPEQVEDWHIGGYNERVIEWIRKAIGQ